MNVTLEKFVEDDFWRSLKVISFFPVIFLGVFLAQAYVKTSYVGMMGINKMAIKVPTTPWGKFGVKTKGFAESLDFITDWSIFVNIRHGVGALITLTFSLVIPFTVITAYDLPLIHTLLIFFGFNA
jgi:hypothetical protein